VGYVRVTEFGEAWKTTPSAAAIGTPLVRGAYRDNEVTAAHLLMRKLDAIKTAGGKLAEITLAPLAREHLGQLIADALRCEPERAGPLAQLVHEKTGGNPFFAIQFISALAEERMLTVDHDAARWSWDLDAFTPRHTATT
jgi:predicted ATPase